MPIHKTSTKPLENQYTTDYAVGPAAQFKLLLNPPPDPCDWWTAEVAAYPRNQTVIVPDYENSVLIDGKTVADWRVNPTDSDTGLNDFYGKRTAPLDSNQ